MPTGTPSLSLSSSFLPFRLESDPSFYFIPYISFSSASYLLPIMRSPERRSPNFDPAPAAEVFERKQDTYKLVVDNNYLHHRDIMKEFRRAFAQFDSPRAVTALDLGCGDCFFSASCFASPSLPHRGHDSDMNPGIRPSSTSTKLVRFVGVDLAQAPLDVARASRPFAEDVSTSFHRADFFDYLDSVDDQEQFDVVLSTFAVHHLTTGRKLELLRRIADRLRPGGMFLFGDVTNMVEGRSREQMLNAWEPVFLKTGFDVLDDEQRQEVWKHVSNYDLPEDLPTMRQLLEESGFRSAECVYQDGFYVSAWVARA